MRDLDGPVADQRIESVPGAVLALEASPDGLRYAVSDAETVAVGDLGSRKITRRIACPATHRRMVVSRTLTVLWNPRLSNVLEVVDEVTNDARAHALGGFAVGIDAQERVLVEWRPSRHRSSVRRHDRDAPPVSFELGPARYVALSPAGLAASHDDEGTIRVQDLGTGRELWRRATVDRNLPTALALSADGAVLAVGRTDGGVETHELR